MKMSTCLKSSLFVLLSFNCLGVFAINFPFRTEDVIAFKTFFQQPSAVEGKTNAEVVGIDIHRAGFSWDDMNTWANADGKVFQDGATTGLAVTIWGASFNASAPFNGGVSRMGWTRRTADGPDCKPVSEGGAGKDVEEKWTSYTKGLEDLSGTLEFSTYANVLHISDTKIQKLKVQMHHTQDSYMHAKRNIQLEQLDMSGSTAPIRELYAYRNNFSTLDALKMDNMRTDGKLFDWMSNIAENKFRFSTMPVKPDGKLYGGHNSLQHPFGVGEQATDGSWEIKAGEFIDLTDEYDIRSGNITSFVWKNEDGDVVTPSMARDGYFRFTSEFTGRELTCEMSNPFFPTWLHTTEPVRVVAEYTSLNKNVFVEIRLMPNPIVDVLFAEGEDVLAMEVVNLNGMPVAKNRLSNRIDLSMLPSGVYIARVYTEKGIYTRSVVKK